MLFIYQFHSELSHGLDKIEYIFITMTYSLEMQIMKEKLRRSVLWQNVEAPVSLFQESPLAGEPRERLFHIHSVHRYQLCTKYLYPSTLL